MLTAAHRGSLKLTVQDTSSLHSSTLTSTLTHSSQKRKQLLETGITFNNRTAPALPASPGLGSGGGERKGRGGQGRAGLPAAPIAPTWVQAWALLNHNQVKVVLQDGKTQGTIGGNFLTDFSQRALGGPAQTQAA